MHLRVRVSFSGLGQREQGQSEELMGQETGEETGEETGVKIQGKFGDELIGERPAGSETPPATTHRARWTRLHFSRLDFLLVLLKFSLDAPQGAICNF